MMASFSGKKKLIWILVGIILLGGGIYLYFYFTTEKSLKIISPNGGEELRAGKTYQIRWKSKKIGKVSILLIKEDKKETKWIIEDFPAGKQKYDWQVFVWEEPRQDYKIAILEYPWQNGNKLDYSDDKFTILGPHFASCDELSIESEWPFIPSDFPNLKRVFITENSWPGDLGGLEGADKKCQEEAESLGFKGNFKAFLGDDTILAVDRLDLEGIFVEAKGIGVLPQEKVSVYLWKSFGQFLETTSLSEKKEVVKDRYELLGEYFQKFLEKWNRQQDEKTCHRLLGRNFEEFFQKLLDPLSLNQEKLDDDFLNDLSNIWLGRVNEDSKRECIAIFAKYPGEDIARNWSYTTTCQNWKTSNELVSGYPPKPEEETEFPICYTPEGKRINAAAVAGLASGLIENEGKAQFFSPFLGKSCNQAQKLLCIEQELGERK